ncbi:MAG: Ig-like domain-containing protein [Lachnospiraceae bacterium]|nr:Ig-like domain-containing protein [Lachnospiraceae bacterium]
MGLFSRKTGSGFVIAGIFFLAALSVLLFTVQSEASVKENDPNFNYTREYNGGTLKSETEGDHQIITVTGDVTIGALDPVIYGYEYLTIKGGGTLNLTGSSEGYGINTRNLVIEDVTVKGMWIAASRNVTIKNAVVDVRAPKGVLAVNALQGGVNSVMTIENSKVNLKGYLRCGDINDPGELVIKNSEIQMRSTDGEDAYGLLSVTGKINLNGYHVYTQKAGKDYYTNYILYKQSDGTYTMETGENQGAYVVITQDIYPTGIPVETILIENSTLGAKTNLLVGAKAVFSATVLPSDAEKKTVKWSVSPSSYASISSDGVLTAKAAGAGKTVTVTASATDGSGVKAQTKVKIKGAVSKIKLSASRKTVKVGKKLTIKAKITVGKGGSKAVKWSVNKKKYASITQKGVLKAKKAGKGKTVTVTAKAKDGSGKKAKIKIKIK